MKWSNFVFRPGLHYCLLYFLQKCECQMLYSSFNISLSCSILMIQQGSEINKNPTVFSQASRTHPHVVNSYPINKSRSVLVFWTIHLLSLKARVCNILHDYCSHKNSFLHIRDLILHFITTIHQNTYNSPVSFNIILESYRGTDFDDIILRLFQQR